MLSILLVGLIIVVFCVMPVMFLAKKFGAENTGLLRCFVTIFIGSLVASIFTPMIPGALDSAVLAMLYWFLLTGLVYKWILGSTYIAGVFIAVIPAAAYFIIEVVWEAMFA